VCCGGTHSQPVHHKDEQTTFISSLPTGSTWTLETILLTGWSVSSQSSESLEEAVRKMDGTLSVISLERRKNLGHYSSTRKHSNFINKDSLSFWKFLLSIPKTHLYILDYPSTSIVVQKSCAPKDCGLAYIRSQATSSSVLVIPDPP